MPPRLLVERVAAAPGGGGEQRLGVLAGERGERDALALPEPRERARGLRGPVREREQVWCGGRRTRCAISSSEARVGPVRRRRARADAGGRSPAGEQRARRVVQAVALAVEARRRRGAGQRRQQRGELAQPVAAEPSRALGAERATCSSSASAKIPNGTPVSNSVPRPAQRRASRLRARAPSSASSRVLPTPGSPVTSTAPPWPRPAALTSVSSSAISRARPTISMRRRTPRRASLFHAHLDAAGPGREEAGDRLGGLLRRVLVDPEGVRRAGRREVRGVALERAVRGCLARRQELGPDVLARDVEAGRQAGLVELDGLVPSRRAPSRRRPARGRGAGTGAS